MQYVLLCLIAHDPRLERLVAELAELNDYGSPERSAKSEQLLDDWRRDVWSVAA